MDMGNAIRLLVFAALLVGPLSLASAAPPASCASKFVGAWTVTVTATGQTYRSQIRADGTLTSACPLCPPVQTWTCSGNTFILTSPVTVTSTLSGDGRRMAGSCCSSVRIGGAPVAAAAKAPAAPKQRALPEPGTLSPAQAAKCPLPADAKANIEKDLREYTSWIENPRSKDERAKGYNNRAVVYFVYRRFDLSIKDREAERALTGKVLCQRCLAQAYLANGQYDRAIAELDPIIGPYTYCIRGMAFHRKGDYDEAVEDYDAAILGPDDARPCGLYGRGLVKLKMGDIAGGKADIAAADAADAKAKYPIGYEAHFCIHGIVAEPAAVAAPSPPPGVKTPAETEKTDLLARLVAWQTRMKEARIPSAAPHLLIASPCPACSPAGFYCTTHVLSPSDLKGKRVALGAEERELGQELSSVGASVASLPPADVLPALESGIIDCVGGRH
jgi:tetratricopeptide (TPR) repeat protein